MSNIQWEKYPLVAASNYPREWLLIYEGFGSSSNTIDAYGRALNDYFQFCVSAEIEPDQARKIDIASYSQDLRQRENPKMFKGNRSGLDQNTIKHRLTILRLYYDYLIDEGVCGSNPVSKGSQRGDRQYSHKGRRAGSRGVQATKKLPWIPNDEQWMAILEALKEEPSRNRLMFALAYDGALRREEVCGLEIRDINPADRLITVRAEISKSYYDRVVPYSEETAELLAQYLQQRRQLSRKAGPLFLSESRRNKGVPISIWTWSKVVEGIAERASLPQLSTHTLRHLRLTDLARDKWELQFIAEFAGHRDLRTTQLYIHLSGREVAQAVQQGMNRIHAWRSKLLKETVA